MNDILEIFNQEAESIDIDLFASTSQLRIVAGQEGTTGLGGHTIWHRFPTLAITKATYREQPDGKRVLTLDVATHGEQIGIVAKGQNQVHPAYHNMPASWQNYVHRMFGEFQNPNHDVVMNLHDHLDAAGFEPFQPRGERPMRSSEYLFELVAPGNNTMENFANGLNLESMTMLLPPRVAALETNYVNREEELIEREAFTSLFDGVHQLYVNYREFATLWAAGEIEDNDELARIRRQSAILTGVDSQGQYALRPTVGYITIGGEELNFFPIRETVDPVAMRDEGAELAEPF